MKAENEEFSEHTFALRAREGGVYRILKAPSATSPGTIQSAHRAREQTSCFSQALDTTEMMVWVRNCGLHPRPRGSCPTVTSRA